MSKEVNYLIGKAELLTNLTPPPKMSPPSSNLYTLDEVVSRLKPQFEKVAKDISELNDVLCPKDYVVTKITLHPSYIAKGHFPKKLLRSMGVRSIGSKAASVKPDKWTKKGEPKLSPSTSIFVAGKKEQLIDFNKNLTLMRPESNGADELAKIWSIEFVEPESKIKKGKEDDILFYEIGLQLIPDSSSDFIKKSFKSYALELGFNLRDDLAVEVSNLWFVPISGPRSRLINLAEHNFIRVVRPVPALRSFKPLVRSLPISSKATLPSSPPLAHDIRVAILDGGLPETHALKPWVNNYKIGDSNADDCVGGTEHGLAVSSAFLFGPLKSGVEAPRPFSFIDHHRIIDSLHTQEDRLELYRTLGHIEDILLSRQYEFINISLGPELSIDDDEVHPWTSLIDSYLADGETFVCIAAGNNGEANEEYGLNRIQVPSDCVNAITIGATDKTGLNWLKAPYSAVGPGRAPGRVKPDMVAFGGSEEQYFHVTDDSTPPRIIPEQGTSFASPYFLRTAVGIRALLGYEISPLAIKALLINLANTNDLPKNNVGWGKVNEDVQALIESPQGVAKILYQGELLPGKYLRVPLPMPPDGIQGKVKIKATCCFSTPVDPQDTSMYTKAGVEISWKPKKGGKPESFFQQVKIATESELRRDAAKWETVLNAEKNKIGSKLESPAFELHYMAREGGGGISGSKAPTIKYAFVVTLEAPKHKEIFSDIIEAYSEILTEIKPRMTVPVKVQI